MCDRRRRAAAPRRSVVRAGRAPRARGRPRARGVLTAPWHERDTQSLVERLGVPVYTPLPDTADDLMRKFGITAEQAGDGSPDLVWLLREKKGEARPYSAGEELPVGVEA